MKCKYCNATWELPASSKIVVEKCPFCDKKLIEEVIEEINSVDAVLKKFYQEEGIEFFKDALRVYNLLVDLCPEHKVERTRIRTALLWGLPEKINKIAKDNSDDIDVKISKLRREFLEGCEVIDVVFDYSVKSILYALGIDLDEKLLQFSSAHLDDTATTGRQEEFVQNSKNIDSKFISNADKNNIDLNDKHLFRNKDAYIQLLVKEFLINNRNITDDIIFKFIQVNKLDFTYNLTVDEVIEDLRRLSSDFKKKIDNKQLENLKKEPVIYPDIELKNDYGFDSSNWCAIGQDFVALLGRDGKVNVTSYNSYRYVDTARWKDIVSIVAGDNILFGINNKGKIYHSGLSYSNIEMIKSWDGIASIAYCDEGLFGVCKDGTVVSSNNTYLNTVGNWKNVKRICAFNRIVIGILENGSIVSNMSWINNLGWTDIIDISIYKEGIIGLTKNRVLMFAQRNFKQWSKKIDNIWGDIRALSAYSHIYLVMKDGELYQYEQRGGQDLFRYFMYYGFENVTKLRNSKLLSVCTGQYTTAFLTDKFEVLFSNQKNIYHI